MIHIEYRAPNDLDFQALRKTNGSLRKNLQLTCLISFALTMLSYVFSKSIVASVLIGGALFLSSVISNLQFFKKIDSRKNLIDDSSAVEVLEVNALQVVDIVPQGSNGPALVFFGENDEALLMVGQWLAEFEPFPVCKFRICRWRDTRDPIRIESVGALIAPEESSATLLPNYSFGKVELFKARPNTLQHDLEISFASRKL